MQWTVALRVAAIVATIAVVPACRTVRGAQVHLIPEGYLGPVVIVYGIDSGTRLERNEEGATIYDVSPDGVLTLQESAPPNGWYRNRYYYVAPDGTRRELAHDGSASSLQVFAGVVGVRETPRENTVVRLSYEAYVVGVPADHDDWPEQRDAKVDGVVGALIEEKGDSFE